MGTAKRTRVHGCACAAIAARAPKTRSADSYGRSRRCRRHQPVSGLRRTCSATTTSTSAVCTTYLVMAASRIAHGSRTTMEPGPAMLA